MQQVLETPQLLPGKLKRPPIQIHAESLDARIVNIVALIKDNYAVSLEF